MTPLSEHRRISIRATAILVFTIVTILTAGLAVSLQYYFGHALARDAARDLYANVATGAADQLINLRQRMTNVVDLLAEYPGLDDSLPTDAQHQLFARVMQQNPLIYGVYLGRKDESFSEIVNLQDGDAARSALQAAREDRWVAISVAGEAEGRKRQYEYLNDNFERRSTRFESTDFEVKSRPWYASAINSNSAETTDIYQFSQLRDFGLTISKRVPGTGTVVAVDITLARFSSYLAQQLSGRKAVSFVFKADGEVVATSGLSPSDQVGLKNLPRDALIEMAGDKTRLGQLVEILHDGDPYFGYVTRLNPGDDRSNFFGILVPAWEVIGTFMDKVRLSITITAAFLLILLPFCWVFATPIVRPIRQLADENDKIRRREYDKVERVRSRVKEVDELSESMVAMVAAIQTHELQQRNLMDAFIRVIAQAIDDKSPYTGGHCARVPELAFLLAEEASNCDTPAFKDFRLETDDQWREYRIAAWLHDCGKITMPEHIVDKGSKLETIYNRIHEVRMRFEVLWRDAEITYWTQKHQFPQQESELASNLERQRQQLLEEFSFVAQCNVGGEYLDKEKVDRLAALSRKSWQRNFDDRLGLSPAEELRGIAAATELPVTEHLLSDKPDHIFARTGSTEYAPELGIDMEVPTHLYNLGEIYNLSISRGTLTAEDRFKINEHMISTIKMLEALPFPEELKNVPRYASTHHETMRGSGYPRKLPGDQLSIPERILAVADVFEALTAADRPYKKAKPVSESVDILYKMVLDNHIDRDCFELFIRSKVYAKYADEYLAPEQRDAIDEAKYLTR